MSLKLMVFGMFHGTTQQKNAPPAVLEEGVASNFRAS
jgi:hypothetical protein